MVFCEDTDFIYPMKADVYYPIISQGEYGQQHDIQAQSNNHQSSYHCLTKQVDLKDQSLGHQHLDALQF